MNLTKPQIIIIGSVLAIILIFILIFLGIIPGLKKSDEPVLPPVALSFWTLNERGRYDTPIQNFRKLYPNVTVSVRNFDNPAEYETAVLNALAAGAGPDIFLVQSGGLLKDVAKLSPAPAAKYSLTMLQNQFPQVVADDFVYQNQIYALPLSIDTLALIYNRDLFNQKGVALPPETWEELAALVPKFVTKDSLQRLATAGAAIGGSRKTVETAADILTLLMLQQGAVSFSSANAQTAFNFYLQFANAVSPSYTWNDSLPADREMFTSGRAAMIFGYASALAELSRRSSLNPAVAPVPQFSGTPKNVALARYWGLGVARQSRNKNAAWDFVIYLTTNFESAKNYSDQNQKPPALNVLINQKVNDLNLGVFARQALIAKSWSKVDPLKVDRFISDAIEAVITGRLTAKAALDQLQGQYGQLVPRSTP